MNKKAAFLMTALIALCVTVALVTVDKDVFAHCDTLDGPVVKDARLALEKGDVTGMLKWVRKGHEQEIRDAFARSLAVRVKGKEARELADRFFFETLVRVHRAGEGAPDRKVIELTSGVNSRAEAFWYRRGSHRGSR